jgi:hypothetical protein
MEKILSALLQYINDLTEFVQCSQDYRRYIHNIIRQKLGLSPNDYISPGLYSLIIKDFSLLDRPTILDTFNMIREPLLILAKLDPIWDSPDLYKELIQNPWLINDLPATTEYSTIEYTNMGCISPKIPSIVHHGVTYYMPEAIFRDYITNRNRNNNPLNQFNMGEDLVIGYRKIAGIIYPMLYGSQDYVYRTIDPEVWDHTNIYRGVQKPRLPSLGEGAYTVIYRGIPYHSSKPDQPYVALYRGAHIKAGQVRPPVCGKKKQEILRDIRDGLQILRL